MWIAITEAHVQTKLTGAELNATRTAALASGQGDPLQEVIDQITREVRGCVAAWPHNILGEGDTIPDECLRSALALIVAELCIRIPGKIVLSEQRVEARKEAVAFLNRVSEGKVRLVQPDVETTEKVAGPATQLVNSRPRQATREDLKGL